MRPKMPGHNVIRLGSRGCDAAPAYPRAMPRPAAATPRPGAAPPPPPAPAAPSPPGTDARHAPAAAPGLPRCGRGRQHRIGVAGRGAAGKRGLPLRPPLAPARRHQEPADGGHGPARRRVEQRGLPGLGLQRVLRQPHQPIRGDGRKRGEPGIERRLHGEDRLRCGAGAGLAGSAACRGRLRWRRWRRCRPWPAPRHNRAANRRRGAMPGRSTRKA